MNAFAALRGDPAFAALRRVSERLGTDPAQVQGAGGNTSVKRDGVMWIKASGTWLADAQKRDVMVPVDLDALRAAMAADAPEAEAALPFVPLEHNPGGLRPSIETTVHAVMDAPVVLHTHCVATIALAIRADGEAIVAARLSDMGAIWVRYVKPGLQLAREIAARGGAGARLIVLGGHGLVAAGATADEAEATLREASRRLAGSVAAGARPTPGLDAALDGTGYVAVEDAVTHALAIDPARLRLACGGPWFPDQVIFLGPSVPQVRAGERADAAGGAAPLVLLPGLGAAMRADATPAARALARGLGDVLARVEPGAPLTPLTPQDVAALLDWDAEKYRQSLDAARP